MRQRQSKYIRVYESLRALLADENRGGEKYLLPERELSRRFAVDRLTLRRALDLLARDGLIQKQPGKGSLILSGVRDVHRAGTGEPVAFVLPRGAHRVDRITEPFNAELFYLVEKELNARNLDLLYSTVEEDGGLADRILQRGVAGLILVSQIPDTTLDLTRTLGLPVVLINRESDHFPMVLEDRRNGFLAALERLADLGHRKILFINGVPGHYTTETCRLAVSFFTALRPEVQIIVRHSTWDFDGGLRVMGEILGGRGTPPTAVCACNDTVALGAMEGAKRDGVEVPEGMSFIGFDDTEQSRQCTPPLSTVSVDSPLMARLAVETLFSFRAGGNPGPIRTLVPARLLLRESVRDLLSGDNTETRRILQ